MENSRKILFLNQALVPILGDYLEQPDQAVTFTESDQRTRGSESSGNVGLGILGAFVKGTRTLSRDHKVSHVASPMSLFRQWLRNPGLMARIPEFGSEEPLSQIVRFYGLVSWHNPEKHDPWTGDLVIFGMVQREKTSDQIILDFANPCLPQKTPSGLHARKASVITLWHNGIYEPFDRELRRCQVIAVYL